MKSLVVFGILLIFVCHSEIVAGKKKSSTLYKMMRGIGGTTIVEFEEGGNAMLIYSNGVGRKCYGSFANGKCSGYMKPIKYYNGTDICLIPTYSKMISSDNHIYYCLPLRGTRASIHVNKFENAIKCHSEYGQSRDNVKVLRQEDYIKLCKADVDMAVLHSYYPLKDDDAAVKLPTPEVDCFRTNVQYCEFLASPRKMQHFLKIFDFNVAQLESV